jgi:hypothetical protein
LSGSKAVDETVSVAQGFARHGVRSVVLPLALPGSPHLERIS